jgi:hypothetical protein
MGAIPAGHDAHPLTAARSGKQAEASPLVGFVEDDGLHSPTSSVHRRQGTRRFLAGCRASTSPRI